MTQTELVHVLQALLTPLVAIIALGIAFAQWWTARNRLKLDLFERRWAVYQTTRMMLAELVTHGRASAEAERAFLAGIRGAKWIFDDRVDWYLTQELWPRIVILGGAVAALDGPPTAAERMAAGNTRVEIARWAADQDSVIDAKFSSYLKVDQGVFAWLRARLHAGIDWNTRGPLTLIDNLHKLDG